MKMLPENEKLIRNTENLLRIVKKNHDELTAKYGNNDFRVNYIGLTGNIFHSLLLHFTSTTMTISLPEWWKTYYQREPSENDKSAIQELGKLTKHAFVVFYFSKVETMMRKTINFVSPSFDSSGVKPMKQIYDKYLTVLDLSNDIPLYDITRLLRNSLHINGLFISSSGNNREIIWDGKKYDFKHKKLIDFVTVDFVFYLFKELINASYRVVTSNYFAQYQFIEDKYY